MAACDMLDCELEYEEKPHLMGRPPLPDIRRRVARGPVSFAPSVEIYTNALMIVDCGIL